jgi:hypothetical protein
MTFGKAGGYGNASKPQPRSGLNNHREGLNTVQPTSGLGLVARILSPNFIGGDEY